MGSTGTKAVLLLVSCGAIAACGRPDGSVVSSPRSVTIVQPADRAVEF